MAREKSIKVRLSEQEDKFLTSHAEKLGLNRSEYIRLLLLNEMSKKQQ